METSSVRFITRKSVNKKEKKRLMREDYVIGNINRRNQPSIAIAVLKSDLKLLLKSPIKTGTFQLMGSDGESYDVKLRDIQLKDLTYELHHVDFQIV